MIPWCWGSLRMQAERGNMPCCMRGQRQAARRAADVGAPEQRVCGRRRGGAALPGLQAGDLCGPALVRRLAGLGRAAHPRAAAAAAGARGAAERQPPRLLRRQHVQQPVRPQLNPTLPCPTLSFLLHVRVGPACEARQHAGGAVCTRSAPRRFVRDQANATGGYGEGRTDFSESYRSAGNESLGALADSDWLYVHPAGMRQLLKYVNSRRAPWAAWSLAMPTPSLHRVVSSAPSHGHSVCLLLP